MAALGGLLGAYGSDEDEALSSQESEGEQPADAGSRPLFSALPPPGPTPVLPRLRAETKTGQVTLFGDDDDAGGLSHLTGCAAARAKAEADTAAGAAQQGAAAGPRPGSAGSDQAAAMDVDGGAPAPAAGGAEQPPAAGEGAQQGQADPLALLPPEMRQPPEGEGYPDVQASGTAGIGCWRAIGVAGTTASWAAGKEQLVHVGCMVGTWLPSAQH